MVYSPTKHRGGVAEIAHANKSDDGADERQPLEPFGHLGVARKAQVTGEAYEPHGGTAPKANDQPAHNRFLSRLG
jgi:hypothetical protein